MLSLDEVYELGACIVGTPRTFPQELRVLLVISSIERTYIDHIVGGERGSRANHTWEYGSPGISSIEVATVLTG